MSPRILVVEDDAIVAQDVAETLRDLGYEVQDVVDTGRDAIRAARDAQLDLVLMDVRLAGEMDGADVARKIWEDREVPVVYLTAYADDATLRKVTRGLPYGYIVKPYDARILRAEIEIALARQRMERSLRERERWFERLVANSHDIVALLDERGVVEYQSPSMERVLGHGREERVGQSALELVHPGDRNEARQALERCVATPNEPVELDVRMLDADGEWRAMNVVGRSFEGPEGKPKVVVSARDVTRVRRAVAELRESEARYRSLFEDNVAGTFQSTADGEILAANPALARMLGYESAEELSAVSAASFYPEPEKRDRVLERLRERGSLRNEELELRRRNGSTVWVLANLSVHRREGREVVTGTTVDITDRKQLEAHLQEMAFRDPLTGLANRRFLQREAERSVALAERSQRHTALVYVDIGQFKEINDSLGHAAGDAVLTEIARRLETESRESDLIARVGGDEFAALLSEVEGPEAAVEASRRLAGALERPIDVDGQSVPVHAHFGVAIYPDHGEDFQQLLSAADRAMYRAKDAARESVHLFDPGSDVVLAGRSEQEDEFREALEEDQFLLHYQPILEVGNDSVAGAEAFARWTHPERGLLSAADFVPMAERHGWVPELDRRLVQRLLDDLHRWRTDTRPGWISVNLSPTTLADADFRQWLAETVRGRWPEDLRLVFDVSEQDAIRNPELLTRLLSDLAGLPVTVALDNFGTGPGSVAFLDRAPVQLLKVDRSFLRPPGSQGPRGSLARALVKLGHAAGMDVALEGVELEAQYASALDDEPDYIQGYYTGPPVARERFRERADGSAE